MIYFSPRHDFLRYADICCLCLRDVTRLPLRLRRRLAVSLACPPPLLIFDAAMPLMPFFAIFAITAACAHATPQRHAARARGVGGRGQ